ncbi:MAG: VWA domain-containing protein, partial [Kiritimatiellia bacterium]
AGPRWGVREAAVYRKGRDVAVVLDVSRSMLAEDVAPNRLRRAKTAVLDLLDEMDGGRVGIVAFRKRAVLLCPMTTDYSFARHALETAGLHSAPPGPTDLGEGIRYALDMFRESANRHLAIIVISDGEDLSAQAVSSAEEAAERNIPVFTVGIGTAEGARIPVSAESGAYLIHEGSAVVTKLQPATFLEVQKITGGSYIPPGPSGMSGTDLGIVYREHIARVAAQKFIEGSGKTQTERFQWFLLPAVVCFLGIILPVFRLRRPGASVWLVLAIATAGLQARPSAALGACSRGESFFEGSPGRKEVLHASLLYRRGDYEEAADYYIAAASRSKGTRKEKLEYNAAVSLHRAGRGKEAEHILRRIAAGSSDSSLLAHAFDALGHVLYHGARSAGRNEHISPSVEADMYRESAECFLNALRLGQVDGAGSNLIRALRDFKPSNRKRRVAEIRSRCAGKPPHEIAAGILRRQQEVTAATAEPAANITLEAFAALHDAFRKQRKNRSVLSILLELIQDSGRHKTLEPGSPEELVKNGKRAAEGMEKVIRSLDRLDVDMAYHGSLAAEEHACRLWKELCGTLPETTPETKEAEDGEQKHSGSPEEKSTEDGTSRSVRPETERRHLENMRRAEKMEDARLETLLRKALEREKEHEMEKIRESRYAPVSREFRDW